METPRTYFGAFWAAACFCLAMSIDAAPLSANDKVLILGTAADTHKAALEGLIAGDAAANALNITVDSFETTDVRNAYFTDSNGNLSHPWNLNPLQQKLDEGWDAILINPADLNIRVSPEMGMEGIRLIERYVRGTGAELFILVPTFDPTFTGDAGYTSDATDVKERAYRIADALEISAIPVGICWQTVLADGTLTAIDTTLATPNTHAVNTYITTIFSELFEVTSATSSYRHGGISAAEFSTIAGHAHQAWQDALTATHYTGDYVGIFSPMPDVHDAANKLTGWGGASTEGMTRDEWSKIYERQGVTALRGDSKGVDFSKDYDFYVSRGWLYDSSINYYRNQDPGNDLRTFGLHYKDNSLTKMVGWGLSRTGEFRDWFYPTRTSASLNFGPQPYKRYVPNMPGFVRYWTDYPNAQARRYGDGHLNDNLIMMQSSMIYTMSSAGANPLENIILMEDWTGPQRYSAGLGYSMIMGIGRLKKLEMAPVATCYPRLEVTANTANVITLPGHDFNGLPITASIVTQPANGTIVPNGSDFTYTPDPGFSGLDTVTYKINNGIEDSHPLTIHLVVGPYIPSTPAGMIFFEDNFDDENIDDWNQSGIVRITNASSTSRTWRDGFRQPYDGTAGLWLTGSFGKLWKNIDTTGFENIELSIRVGSGNIRDEKDYPDQIQIEWYDGSTWHTAISHGHTYFTNRLLHTYEVSLPAGAAGNPDFQLRLYGEGVSDGKLWKGGYVDSVRLSGDIVQVAPVASNQTVDVDMNGSVAITLDATDGNMFDTLTWNVVQPGDGGVTGAAPNLTYTPDTNFTGTDTFTFTVNDGTVDSNVATVTINVRNNTAPVVDAGSAQAVTMTGGFAWAPDAMTPVGWYDASDASTIIGNGSVANEWRDKSGNGLHLRQIDPDLSPETGVNSIGGLNTLKFDDQFLDAATNPFGATISDAFVIAVHKVDNKGTRGSLFTLSGSTSSANRWQAETPNRNTAYFYTGGNNNEFRISNDYAVENGDDVIFSAYGSTTDNVQQMFKNGTVLAEDTDGHATATNGNIRVGGAGSSYTDASIGELIIINGSVTPEERQQLEGFLAHKWGLTANLPVGHPYLAAAPQRNGVVVNLNGQVTDGEGDPLTYQWSVVSGPGNVFLGTPDAPAATATIYEAGTYVLELTVDDGLAQTTSQVTITVSEPVVDLDNDGIADSWETTYFPGQEATIDGTADSDGDLVLDYFEYLYESDPTDINDTGFWVIVPAPANRMAEWTLKEGFQPGSHYLIKMSTDLSTWNDLPVEHYTLHTTTNAGMTTVQLELTHNYPGHLFISLAQP